MTNTRHPLLELEAVTKCYDGPQGGSATMVLDGISLSLHAGDALAVVGPSGSGKSTLLNLMGTLDHPTSGTIRFDGVAVDKMREPELAALRNRDIGFVFQLHHLLPQCTALENVLIPTLPQGRTGHDSQTRQRAEALFSRMKLADRMHYRPAQLSGGERQRIAVMRALINQPRLILADEPTGALDHASTLSLGDVLLELNAEFKVTLVVVTHSVALASSFATQYRISDGKISLEKSSI